MVRIVKIVIWIGVIKNCVVYYSVDPIQKVQQGFFYTKQITDKNVTVEREKPAFLESKRT